MTALAHLLDATAEVCRTTETPDDYGDRWILAGRIAVLRVALDDLETRLGVNNTPQPKTPATPPPPPPKPGEKK